MFYLSNFISVDNLYYAVMANNSDVLPLPTYSTPKPIIGAAKIQVDPTNNKVPYYGDGVNIEMAQVITTGKVTLQSSALTLAICADMFGHQLDGMGGLIYNKNDNAPYIAIFYRRKKANGGFRYVKLLKCMFDDPSDAAATANASVTPQDDSLSGSLFSRNSDGNWKKVVDDETIGFLPATATNFFSQVDGAVDVIAPTIASTVPLANATAVPDATTFTWTLSESLNPSTVTPTNFYLVKDTDGSIVGATVAYNDTAKTVILTPTVALSAASKYLAIVDSDVTDVAGNHIVPITKIFTTA
jgi:phi13 family phage major tail protein